MEIALILSLLGIVIALIMINKRVDKIFKIIDTKGDLIE